MILVQFIACLTYQTQSNLSKGPVRERNHVESDIHLQVSGLSSAVKLLNFHNQSIGQFCKIRKRSPEGGSTVFHLTVNLPDGTFFKTFSLFHHQFH